MTPFYGWGSTAPRLEPLQVYLLLLQVHSHLRAWGTIATYFDFQTKQGPKMLVSNIRDKGFQSSEIIWTKNFTIFIMYATNFGQFMTAFIFSNYTGKIDHFMLDLLKRSVT